MFQAHRLLYHSTLGLRVIKRKKNDDRPQGPMGYLPWGIMVSLYSLLCTQPPRITIGP